MGPLTFVSGDDLGCARHRAKRSASMGPLTFVSGDTMAEPEPKPFTALQWGR